MVPSQSASALSYYIRSTCFLFFPLQKGNTSLLSDLGEPPPQSDDEDQPHPPSHTAGGVAHPRPPAHTTAVRHTPSYSLAVIVWDLVQVLFGV